MQEKWSYRELAANRVSVRLKEEKIAALFDQVRAEQWNKIGFLGGTTRFDRNFSFPLFRLPEEYDGSILKEISTLSHLEVLAIVGLSDIEKHLPLLQKLRLLRSLLLISNQIGDRGVNHILKINGMMDLHLDHNTIGVNGIKNILDHYLNSSEKIRTLSLRSNPGIRDLGVTPEIFDRADAQAILSDWRNFREEDISPLNEARILVLGDEAAGKTSLIRFLIDNKPRNRSEEKTLGINKSEKVDTSEWRSQGSDIKVNIWDFGGQEIQQTLHRYFLARRCLYLLVLENRREDDAYNVQQWLNSIQYNSDSAPVIVIYSKCDTGRAFIRKDDETELRRKFPQIQDFVMVSTNDDNSSHERIRYLRDFIAQTLNDNSVMPHIRDHFSPVHRRIRDKIEEMSRKMQTIKREDFSYLCDEESKIESRRMDEASQRSLLAKLHDLGVIVAYGLDRSHDAFKREIHILDPNWLTQAIYRILDKSDSREREPCFTRHDLGIWLNPNIYPESRHDFIIKMMIERDIGLAISLNDRPHHHEEKWLVPRVLPSNTPDSINNWPSGLIFRYVYEFPLLSDFFPRFIVESYEKHKPGKEIWLNGIVLIENKLNVLVINHNLDNCIDIRIAGDGIQAQEALRRVRGHLDRVHELYKGLNPEARVPLPDLPHIDVSYLYLQQLAQEEGRAYRWRPEGAKRKYSVRELLDGIDEPGIQAEKEKQRRQRRDIISFHSGWTGWIIGAIGLALTLINLLP